jgi:hypothetical protein
MPVADPPVHPMTIRSDGTLWGCNTSRPGYKGRMPGYWAPGGYTIDRDGIGIMRMVYIKDTSGQECHTATRFDDPACKSCERVVDVDK